MQADTRGNFTFPNALRGSNHINLRIRNERLVINLIQDAGALSKAEIARASGLSAQAVATIVNRLIEDGLLQKKDAIKGKVGQPSVPIELCPNGAVSIGIKVGRRSIEAIAIDLNKDVIVHEIRHYDVPEPQTVLGLISGAYTAVQNSLSEHQKSRLLGIGIALPSDMSGWNKVIGLTQAALSGWEKIDIQTEMENMSGLPCHVLNDATSACLAELAKSNAKKTRNMIYYYFGTFIGGGLVLDGQLIEGPTGNAAAIGSIALGISKDNVKYPPQLIEKASLQQLERHAHAKGFSLEDFLFADSLSDAALSCFDEWADDAANAIAFSAIGVTALLEIESVVIDGVLAPNLIERLTSKIENAIAFYNSEGIAIPNIFVGSAGSSARVFGASVLPFKINFDLVAA